MLLQMRYIINPKIHVATRNLENYTLKNSKKKTRMMKKPAQKDGLKLIHSLIHSFN